MSPLGNGTHEIFCLLLLVTIKCESCCYEISADTFTAAPVISYIHVTCCRYVVNSMVSFKEVL